MSLSPADMGIPDYEGTFLDFLDFRVVRRDADSVRLRMPLTRQHSNTMGMAHGGIIMAMLDIAGAFSAHSQHVGEMVSITVTQSTQFMRAVRGGELVAEGRVVRRTRNLVFTESEILDPTLSEDRSQQICASAHCTFKLVPRERR